MPGPHSTSGFYGSIGADVNTDARSKTRSVGSGLDRNPASAVSERSHWKDARSPSSRNDRRCERRDRENPGGGSQGYRIERAELIERNPQAPAEQHGETQTNRESDGGDREAFAKDEAQHVGGRRADRHPHAELADAARDQVTAHAIQANHCNEGARKTKRHEHPCGGAEDPHL